MDALLSKPEPAGSPDPNLMQSLDPAPAPLSRREDVLFAQENADRGFPPQNPYAESHPELRANVHSQPLHDPPARPPARRFRLARLPGWMR